jgi:hypothetical protein
VCYRRVNEVLPPSSNIHPETQLRLTLPIIKSIAFVQAGRNAEIFPGEGAPHRFAYALAPVRLYRKAKGTYNPSPVHDRVDLVPDARVAKLRGTIHHFSVRSLGDQMAKLNRYTDALVDDLAARGETISMVRLVLEFPANFIKAYFGRRHFLRGAYGFMTAMNFAFYRYLRVAKHLEAKRLQAARERRP